MNIESAENNSDISRASKSIAPACAAPKIAKSQVAESFGRAAGSYDKVAHFQRDVGARLLSLLPNGQYETAIDLGSGTGYFTPKLSSQLDVQHVVGLDLSEGMVAYAQRQRGGESLLWTVGDAESLPLKDESVDVIYSSLAVQWCSSYPSLFTELFRVLKPGGVVAFSTLLDGTLRELEHAWTYADSYRHVNNFSDASVVREASSMLGFECLEEHQYTDVLQYESVQALTRELKMLGAHNLNEGRPRNMTGRERIRRFKQGYESLRTKDGWLPASYEVLLSVLKKPIE